MTEPENSEAAWGEWIGRSIALEQAVDDLFQDAVRGKSMAFGAALASSLIEHLAEKLRAYLNLPASDARGEPMLQAGEGTIMSPSAILRVWVALNPGRINEGILGSAERLILEQIRERKPLNSTHLSFLVQYTGQPLEFWAKAEQDYRDGLKAGKPEIEAGGWVTR